MKTAFGILKEKYLLIEDDKTCEAYTHLVVEAMEEYAKQKAGQVEPEVKVNFAEVNEVIDELIEKNLNKERWQMRPDNWREFVGYEKALKELKTILSKISA